MYGLQVLLLPLNLRLKVALWEFFILKAHLLLGILIHQKYGIKKVKFQIIMIMIMIILFYVESHKYQMLAIHQNPNTSYDSSKIKKVFLSII